MKFIVKKFKNIIYDVVHLLKGNTLPNLKKIRREIFLKRKQSNKKKILIATSAAGLKSQLVFEALVGLSLEYSGSEVEFLLCDEILPACIMNTYFNSKEANLSCGVM